MWRRRNHHWPKGAKPNLRPAAAAAAVCPKGVLENPGPGYLHSELLVLVGRLLVVLRGGSAVPPPPPPAPPQKVEPAKPEAPTPAPEATKEEKPTLKPRETTTKKRERMRTGTASLQTAPGTGLNISANVQRQ